MAARLGRHGVVPRHVQQAGAVDLEHLEHVRERQQGVDVEQGERAGLEAGAQGARVEDGHVGVRGHAQGVADPVAHVALVGTAVTPGHRQLADDAAEDLVHAGVGRGHGGLQLGGGASALGQQLDQSAVVFDDAVVGHLQVEPAQVLQLRSGLHHQDVADQQGLAQARVGVAADDQVDARAGQFAGQGDVAVSAVVGDQDQQVGAGIELGRPAARDLGLVVQAQAAHAGLGADRHQPPAGHADHADVEPAALEDHGLLRELEFAALVADVQGHQREVGAGGQGADVVAAQVELVIADHAGVEADQVQHVHPGAAPDAVVVHLAEGAAGHEVARVEEQRGRGVGALFGQVRGQGHDAAHRRAIVAPGRGLGRVVDVAVVDVEDGEVPGAVAGGGRRDRRDRRLADGRPAAGCAGGQQQRRQQGRDDEASRSHIHSGVRVVSGSSAE